MSERPPEVFDARPAWVAACRAENRTWQGESEVSGTGALSNALQALYGVVYTETMWTHLRRRTPTRHYNGGNEMWYRVGELLVACARYPEASAIYHIENLHGPTRFQVLGSNEEF